MGCCGHLGPNSARGAVFGGSTGSWGGPRLGVAVRDVGSGTSGLVRTASRTGSGVAARARGAGLQTPATSPGSLPSPAGSSGPASSGAALHRLRFPQLRRVRPRLPLTGFRDPRSLIWRRSRLRGLRRSPPSRALPRPATPPRRRATCRRHAPEGPGLASGPAYPTGLRLRAPGISGGRAVAFDSNQYRKRGATRCQWQPRPEEDLQRGSSAARDGSSRNMRKQLCSV